MSAPDLQSLIAGVLRLKTSVDILLRSLAHRGELAALELNVARAELATTGALVVAAGLAFFFAGFALTFIVAAIFWDTPHRVTALAWLTAIEIALGAAAAWWAHRRWRSWRPLSATQEQLHQDTVCLQQIFQKNPG